MKKTGSWLVLVLGMVLGMQGFQKKSYATETGTPAPSPAVTSAASPESEGAEDAEGQDFLHPADVQPSLALSLLFSPAMAANSNFNGSTSTSRLSTWGLGLQYQPAFSPSWGVFGAGPEVGAFKVSPGGTINQTSLSSWFVGLSVTYQAKYSATQWLVPTFTYRLYSLNYVTGGRLGETVLTHGPTVGLWLGLSELFTGFGQWLYDEAEIARAYFTLDIGTHMGKSDDAELKGLSTVLGLRVEI